MGSQRTFALTVALAFVVRSMTVLAAEMIPFTEALDGASISVERLDDILEYALLVGNGDINGLVYTDSGNVEIVLTKNDVWDARLDTKLDPPLPTLSLIKELGRGDWPNRGLILPEGSTWEDKTYLFKFSVYRRPYDVKQSRCIFNASIIEIKFAA